jgi:hypothetical protein
LRRTGPDSSARTGRRDRGCAGSVTSFWTPATPRTLSTFRRPRRPGRQPTTGDRRMSCARSATRWRKQTNR